MLLTYWVTAASLAQRDEQIIQSKLGEYAVVYSNGGLARAERHGPRRAADRARATVRARRRSRRRGAGAQHARRLGSRALETASLRLSDGTLVQVGKSKEARLDLLRRVRAALGLVTLSIIVLAFTGGWLATQSALRPIRRSDRGRRPHRPDRAHRRTRDGRSR